ncbi:hypothetical protein ILYODFUR_004497 [Ilyodon furcidens]|uniref:Uncharacterized protein n=1 Tax=Ilyodon furcidens TaxID=33524 RepID=A0ABV0T6V0_9TELE
MSNPFTPPAESSGRSQGSEGRLESPAGLAEIFIGKSGKTLPCKSSTEFSATSLHCSSFAPLCFVPTLKWTMFMNKTEKNVQARGADKPAEIYQHTNYSTKTLVNREKLS